MSGKTVQETLGFLGVMASLVFVGTEIRQNTIAARSAAYQELGLHIATNFYLQTAHDPQFAELTTIATDPARLGEIDDTGWTQLRNQMMAALRTMETVWLQVEEGLLPPDALERFGLLTTGRGLLSGPVFERLWPGVRGSLHAEFYSFLVRQFDIQP